MTVDTYPARHAGPDPVLGEMLGVTDVVFAFRASGTTLHLPSGNTATTPETVDEVRRHVDTLHVLAELSTVALLNEVCGRCRAHFADADLVDGHCAPTDEPWCQGCLDEVSHAAEERGHRDALHRMAGPELVASWD